jgi:HK97 family phage portal protein
MKEALLQRFVNNWIWSFRGVNLEDPRKAIDGYTVGELFGGSPSKSGKSVNSDNALTISAAWRALQVLGGAASSIPSKPFQKTDTGRNPLKNHPTVNIFTNRVNSKYTTPVWWDRVINHLHLRGNHYAYPIRNQIGQVAELRLENPDQVTVYEDRNSIVYKIYGDEKIYRADEFIHVPHLGSGTLGKSTVSYAKDDLGNEMSRKDYAGEVWFEGGKPQSLLSPSQFLNATQRTEAKNAWLEAKRQSHDIIMPAGFTHSMLGFKPDEMQVLQSGQHTVADVARWFGTPRNLLFDPEGGAYNSNEHDTINFLTYTMSPIFTKIEYEYSSKIYQLPREQRYYMEFDMNGFVRPDTVSRATSYGQLIHAGVMKPSEARNRENLPFDPASDRLFINSGSVPLDLMDDFVKGKASQPAPVKREHEFSLNGHDKN